MTPDAAGYFRSGRHSSAKGIAAETPQPARRRGVGAESPVAPGGAIRPDTQSVSALCAALFILSARRDLCQGKDWLADRAGIAYSVCMETEEAEKLTAEYGLVAADILLPAKENDIGKWAVIACDQYTQNREYWTAVERLAEQKPSALHIILPEIYLEDAERADRIASIHNTMREYLDPRRAGGSVFAPAVHGMIYVERTTGYSRTRRGLVAAVDLDTYDWNPGAKTLVRATEQTIAGRLPPRMEIRRGAPLESPHIMLLVNDPEDLLIGKTAELVKYGHTEGAAFSTETPVPLYDTDLMLNAGHITGWAAAAPDAVRWIACALKELAVRNTEKDGSVFLFAVGDGNHSLATAKAVWDEFKAEHPEEAAAGFTDMSGRRAAGHPARYALAEIVNLYDEGLTFEPIHRAVFGADSEKLTAFLRQELGGELKHVYGENSWEKTAAAVRASRAAFGFVFPASCGTSAAGPCETACACLETGITELAVSPFQKALDKFVRENPQTKIDYIHGEDELLRLGRIPGTTGILLPPVAKDSLFSTVAASGPLPRKSFSMGEASEKRFYMESRRLFS